MKRRLSIIVGIVGALALATVGFGRGFGGRAGGGGRAAASRPSGGSGSYRPSGGVSHSRPSTAPSRPSYVPPSGGGAKGGGGGQASRPSPGIPSRPSGSGSGLPSSSGGGSASRLPTNTLPATRPNIPTDRPTTRPGGSTGGGGRDFIGLPADKPGAGVGVGVGAAVGAAVGAGIAARPGQGGGGLQGKPGNNPGLSRPGQGGVAGDRPHTNRPDLPDRWQHANNNFNNTWNTWNNQRVTNINNFQVNRASNWSSINQRSRQSGWARQYNTPAYRNWRSDVWTYRGRRCEEIWSSVGPWHNELFDNRWWGSCAWRRPGAVVIGSNTSPWWWWRPFAWASAGAFFGATIASEAIVYDPGTTVIYEGDTYYVDGQPAGTAESERQESLTLADPPVAQTPVPEPAPEGQTEKWMPLGVWALTQQEQGDASTFFQLSIDKEGIIAGAYKNAMTGEEKPVVGRLDKKTQKAAWHIGDLKRTVYETSLSGLENDVASLFVHFGTIKTQTWLMVRLPSPEMPPGVVKIPEIKKS